MKTYATVVGIVIFGNKLLLLKRTPERRNSPNKWQSVSGFVGECEACEDAVLREVKEETGLDGEIINDCQVVVVHDDYGNWIAKPFLIKINSDKIILDRKEHNDYRWINKEELENYDCVPGIRVIIKMLGL